MKSEKSASREMNLFTGIRNGLLAVGAVLMLSAPAAEAQSTVRIMPLGDSLTSSLDGHASYRYWLWNALQKYNFDVDFVGTLYGVGSGPSPYNFDQNHEGIAGATTDDIVAGIAGWASATQPDIVLLLIGANDLEAGLSPRHALLNIRTIIQTLRQINPQICILWATLPPIPGVKNISAFNNGVMANAGRWSTRNSPIRVVNLSRGFDPKHWTLDGQHPNAQGEKFYANRFWGPLVQMLHRFGQRGHR